jgi:hypothetical protein
MSGPLVSVLMSVYNGDQFLCEAIESILGQSLRDLELIVVNDGSTDATARMLDEYQHKDPRVRVFNQENIGYIESLNRGAGFARGRYIAPMDADDISLWDRLALLVSVLEKHRELGVLGGAMEVINASGTKIDTCYFPTEHDEIRSDLVRGRCPMAHPAVVMRTQAFLLVGGYRKVVVHAEDYDLWLRISDRFRLANLDTVVYKYRRHSQQASVRKLRQQKLSALAARAAALSRIDGKPDPLDSIAEITPTVLSALGVDKDQQRAFVVRAYLTCIKTMCDAGEERAARDAVNALLGSPEWKGAELFFVADLRLLSARIFWRQQRYLRSVATAICALLTRPVILGRPLKPLMRRMRSGAFGDGEMELSGQLAQFRRTRVS